MRRFSIAALPALLALAAVLAGGRRAVAADDTSAPKTPKQLRPEDGTLLHNFPRTMTFEWTEIGDRSGVKYMVEIETYYPGRSPATGVWRSETFGPLDIARLTYTHIGDQSARWRVWAVDGAGNAGKQSPWRGFNFDTSALAAPAPGPVGPVATPQVAPEPPAPAEPVAVAPPNGEIEEPAGSRLVPASTPATRPQLAPDTTLLSDLLSASPRAKTGSASTSIPRVVLRSPPDGAVIQKYPPEITLSWEPLASPPGLKYTVEVQTYYPLGGGGGAWRSQRYRDIAGASVLHRHPGDLKAQWRVWAADEAGNAGEMGAWRSFSVETNGSPERSREMASIGPAPALPLAPPTEFPAPPLRKGPGATATAEEAPAPPASAPSPTVMEAAAGVVLKAPALLEPPDGVILHDDEPYIACKWEDIPGARYTLEVQTFYPEENKWVAKSWGGLTTPQRTPAHEAPRRGRWRVQAVVAGQTSPWSPWRYFSFHGEGSLTDTPDAQFALPEEPPAAASKAGPPPAPIPLIPENGAVVKNAARAVELIWRPGDDRAGVQYICYVERPRPPGSASAGGPPSTFRHISEPRLMYQAPASGEIAWWVAAVDAGGRESANSEKRFLTLQIEDASTSRTRAATPVPIGPLNDAYLPPGPVELRWAPVGLAKAKYRVEIQVYMDQERGGGLWRQAVTESVEKASYNYLIGRGQILRWRVAAALGDEVETEATPWQTVKAGE